MMRYEALFGWGIVIYAVTFLTWFGFMVYGYSGYSVAKIAQIIALVVVVSAAASHLRLRNTFDTLPYSVSWAVIVGLLDAVFAVPFAGWTMYLDWGVWVGYALVALLPLLIVRVRMNRPDTNTFTV